MADVCAWCGSSDTAGLFTQYQCHVCGNVSTAGVRDVPTSMSNEGITVADITPPTPVSVAAAPVVDTPVETAAEPAVEATVDVTEGASGGEAVSEPA